MRYEAVLFDMDGVLIDTHRAVTDFWLALAAEHQLQLSDDDFTRHIYGVPGAHTLEVLFPMIKDAAYEQTFVRMAEYEAHQQYIAVNGVVALLAALKQHRIPAALVTSGERRKIVEVFNQLELNGSFAGEIAFEDIEHGKPHPEPYLKGADIVGKAPQRCVVFEDSISGVQAGVVAGALCVGIGVGDTLREFGAAHVIPDFSAVTLEALDDGAVKMQLIPEYHLLFDHA
jgi:HAD superfamily hydrolase (TIGR01509 family)